MWRCPKCSETVEQPFEVCWKCGTSADGTEDLDFQPEPDGDAIRETGRVVPWQFSLRTMLVFVTLWSVLLALWRCFGRPVIEFVAIVVLGNVFSALVGLVVTWLLGKPEESDNHQ
ncbi:MAG TPA: hypothetical protein VMY42_01240 [Thermoguttaceae bacterium]|nr:hypothetical protein [Thermoguttaceae bacterium]